MKRIETWLEEQMRLYEKARDAEAEKAREFPATAQYFERIMGAYDARYMAYKELLQLIYDGAFSNARAEE